ncbi:MAG: hypothetical protein KFW07_03440 [Mycoplasmataceae bacterium]|nr:hypothetical protein [Mycoplasmataceae bacterium]
MKIKAQELWEELFGEQKFVFDFSNKLILKSEFQTDSLFSWDLENYDVDDEKFFIASIEAIKLRNKQSIFEIDDNKYIVTKNPDYSYSILSTTKINDEKCPINFDLFLNNKINNYEEKDYSFIIIAVKKMSQDMLNIFNNYIIDYLKNYKELLSFDLDNANFSRTELRFQFQNNDDFNTKKALDISLTISSLMPLIIHRLSLTSIELWIQNDLTDSNKFFNIFVTSTRAFENNFKLKEMEILGMITSFENSIFVDEESKKQIEKKGIFSDSFVKAKNSGTEGVYQYKFLRSDIAEYNKIIFNKKS